MKTKKNTIRLTESELKRVITESVKKVLRESIELAKNVPSQIQGKIIEKMKKEYPDLDPDGFFYMGGTLKHSGKKAPKRAKSSGPKEVISKPEDMSMEDYIQNFVPKYNKKFGALYSDVEAMSPEWRDLKISTGNADFDEAYTNRYYLSSTGCIMVANATDVRYCHITKPYFDAHNGRFQINLRLYDGYGKEIDHKNRGVVNLVRSTFGPDEAMAIRQLEMQMARGKKTVDLGNGEEA